MLLGLIVDRLLLPSRRCGVGALVEDACVCLSASSIVSFNVRTGEVSCEGTGMDVLEPLRARSDSDARKKALGAKEGAID